MARANPRALRSGDPLDQPLLRLSADDSFTVRDACENVLVVGGIGSGKTSGPGRALRRAMFRAGCGALVLVTKPDEVEACLADARATGRMDSVIRVDARHGFNFIQHELARHGLAGIGTVVEYIMRILEIVRLAMPNAGRVGDAFWENSARQLVRYAVIFLYAAYGKVEIAEIIRFILSAPKSEQIDDPAWRAHSFMCATIIKAYHDPVVRMDADTYDRAVAYWRDEFANFDSKLRMNITSTVSTALDRFTLGRLAKLFCGETTFLPGELTLCGAIIVLDMPVLEWNEDSVIAQQIIKYAWQRVVLSRNALPPQFRLTMVCCFVDEAQSFINSADREFLSLSRSSRCCTIFLTQSIATVIATIGGENPKHQADALFAQFGTKIFCSNSCPETNRFAADTIGRSIQRRGNYSEGENSGWSFGLNMGEGSNSGTSSGFGISVDPQGKVSRSSNVSSSSGYNESTGRNRGHNSSQSTSSGFSEAMDYEIEPAEFSRSLKTGGPANDNIVTAVWFTAGKRFAATGRNWLLASFEQARAA